MRTDQSLRRILTAAALTGLAALAACTAPPGLLQVNWPSTGPGQSRTFEDVSSAGDSEGSEYPD